MARRPQPSQVPRRRPAAAQERRSRPKPAYLTLPEYPCCRLPNQPPQYPYCPLPEAAPRSQPPRRPFSWRSLGLNILVLLLLSGMVAGVGGGLWLAAALMFNPDSVTSRDWLRRWLPESGMNTHSPQSVADIDADLRQGDRFLGTPLMLPAADGEPAPWLVPVTIPLPHCQNQGNLTLTDLGESALLTRAWPDINRLSPDCQQVVELRLYRSLPTPPGRSPRYELLDQLSLGGTPEFRVAEFYRHSARSTGSNTALPFTHVEFLGNRPLEPTEAVWLTVHGAWSRGSNQANHGQVIQYLPDRQELQTSVSWVSPEMNQPEWQDITGDGRAELVVNKTVGLEPAFEVFRLLPGPQLQAVSLLDTASDHPAYEKAIALAQAKLWSPALNQMRVAQTAESSQGTWSNAAQIQLEVIDLHAQSAQAQANRVWSNAGQQLTAHLIDGQWAIALEFLDQQVADQRSDLRQALAAGALWQRINAALRITPEDNDLQVWAALTLAVRRDRTAAVTWWRSQTTTEPVAAPLTPAMLQTLEAALPTDLRQRLDALDRPAPTITSAAPATTPAPAAPPSATPRPQPQSLLGIARPILLSEWGSAVQSSTGGQTYEVEITAIQADQQWQRSPLSFLDLSSEQWRSQLGLQTAQSLQLLHWNSPTSLNSLFQPPQTSSAQVLDAVVRGDRLLALIEGSGSSRTHALATTARLRPAPFETLTWSQVQQTPQDSDRLRQALQTLLRQEGWSGNGDSLDSILSQGAIARVTLDDQTTAMVLRLTASTVSTLQPPLTVPATYTLMVSETDVLLYQEVSGKTREMLVAIAQLDDGSPVLVIDTGRDYQLRFWNTEFFN